MLNQYVKFAAENIYGVVAPHKLLINHNRKIVMIKLKGSWLVP